jgi:putative membrane protein
MPLITNRGAAALPRAGATLVVTACLAAPVSAHTPAVVTPDELWRAWTFDPVILVCLLTLLAVYARGVKGLWARAGRGRGASYGRVLAFLAGYTALMVALVSPLHALGGTLLSAHMAQHGLLAGLAPPLLLIGTPGAGLAWGLSRGGPLRRLAPLWRVLGRLARVLSKPMHATVLHGLTIWVWHAPMLFGAAVEHDWVHALQHLSFFIPGLLFWKALLDRHSSSRTASGAGAAFVTFMHTGLLGGLITMAPAPLYTVYVGRTESWGLTALADQQLAGVFMWVPLGLPYVVAGLVLTSRLVRGHVEGTREPRPGVSSGSVMR